MAQLTQKTARRASLLGMLVVLVAILVVVVEMWGKSRPPIPNLGNTTITVVPGVHMIGGLGPSAAYVVETSDGLVLIDTGLEPDAADLKREIQKLGLDWKTITAILLTHAHGDHVGGAAFLRNATKAKIYAGQGDAAILRAGWPREAFFSTFFMPNHTPRPTSVDVELKGGETIVYGTLTFQAVALPGHTPGSMGYVIERDGQRILFGGDVITMLAGDGDPHPKGLRPLGTYSAYLAPKYRGDTKTTLASLRALRAMPAPDLVLPGHPASDPVPQSPEFSRERWEAMLDVGIRDMEILQQRYETDGADFLDGIPKRLLPGVDYLGDLQGFAVYTLTVGDRLVVVDAPGGEGLIDFLEIQRKAMQQPPATPTDVLLTSVGPEATSGLRSLVERYKVRIFAPNEGIDVVKKGLPEGANVLAADEIPKLMPMTMTSIPLRGRGSSPQAYVLRIDGKTVLISGRIPVLFDQRSIVELSADLGGSRDQAMDYLLAINTLESLEPDLWLPAVPSDAQNANLYDGDWHHTISNNYRLGRTIKDQSR